MKRHPGLQPLSRHHHFALVRALELRRAAEAPAAEQAARLQETARAFLEFWQHDGKTHFREEEEVLLPAYARVTALDADADVQRMLAQHEQIRALAAHLEAALASGTNLQPLAGELGRLLQEHVRLEEETIFPRIEQTLGEDALRAAGAQLTELHPRRPASGKPLSPPSKKTAL